MSLDACGTPVTTPKINSHGTRAHTTHTYTEFIIRISCLMHILMTSNTKLLFVDYFTMLIPFVHILNHVHSILQNCGWGD